MSLSFLTTELARWDLLALGGEGGPAPETLLLPFFSDERPLRGAAGLCDWRLAGRLSRLLERGRVTGAKGETTLYPPGAKLPFARLVLYGLGPSNDFDEGDAREALRDLLQVVARLGASRAALAPPGRSTGRLSARRAAELCLEALSGHPLSELVLVETAAAQKEAADLVRRS